MGLGEGTPSNEGGGGSVIFDDLLGTETNNPWSRGRVMCVVRHMRGGGGMGGGGGGGLSEFFHHSSSQLLCKGAGGGGAQSSHYFYNFKLFSLQLKVIHKR